MTVKELIKILLEEDQDRLVILSKDAEGNGYSPLTAKGIDTGAYVAEYNWYGEVGLEELTPELEAAGYSEDDVKDGTPALILYPN